MTPREFLSEVVQPNMEDALQNPGDLRLACNAILCMDALMGITFWYLHALGDPRATKYRGPKPDSAFKGDLVASSNCSELRALRDTSYSLKHGRLTRPNRIINSASQVTEGANGLGYFQAGEAVNRPNAPERLLPMTVLALHQCAGS
jgi:hypothetical protein